MSGHSKWSTIKNKKEKADNIRAKIFTKIGREIFVAVKLGGPDPLQNSRLKDVIIKAKANNVPNTNIDRMIKKASGEGNKNSFFNVNYEGYGPEGVAVFVSALTDNKNRTAANVRHYFDKFGGKLGANGCVGYMFSRKGVIYLELNEKDEDSLMEFCLEISVLDCEFSKEAAKITVNSNEFSDYIEKFRERGYKILSAEIEQVAENFVEIKDGENMEKKGKMLAVFEDEKDVNGVWTNCKDL